MAFYWIPNAGLSAVIIHAVADLVASPSQVYSYWRVSPLEFIIWSAAVLVTVFSMIENGIYTSILASLILLLIHIAHPRGYFIGKVTLRLTSTIWWLRLRRTTFRPTLPFIIALDAMYLGICMGWGNPCGSRVRVHQGTGPGWLSWHPYPHPYPHHGSITKNAEDSKSDTVQLPNFKSLTNAS